jgi:hypothetical protein
MIGIINYTVDIIWFIVIRICIINGKFKINNYAPVLSGEQITPSLGNSDEYFNFTVNYTDSDNNKPYYIYCVINNTYHSMNQVNIADNNYTDGAAYIFSTPLPGGTYVYHFETYDGKFYVRYPELNEFPGPTVTSVNTEVPKLTTYSIAPSIGRKNSNFKFIA